MPDAAPTLAVTSRRVYAYFALTYRRNWRGSVTSSVLNPVLFLLAMGVGLGGLVDKGHATGATASLGGMSYRDFLAPGLMAASAMQTAANESTYPVMANIKWLRIYFGMLATPLGSRSVVVGQQAWVVTRLTMGATAFFAVMAAFGAVHSPEGLLAILAAVLTGAAFAAPITAFAATRDTDTSFSAIFRFAVLPMFLFSGTFFPVSQLPSAVRPVAYATPLWHGVALCRDLVVGRATLTGSVGHVAYLSAWTVVGWLLAVRTHRRRLVV